MNNACVQRLVWIMTDAAAMAGFACVMTSGSMLDRSKQTQVGQHDQNGAGNEPADSHERNTCSRDATSLQCTSAPLRLR